MPPPVVFVHGNGDSGALWINNIWRFEANGYKRNQLFAIDFSNPVALSDDSKIQPFRSSTAEAMKELAAFVAQVKKETRRRKVALIASSRGGNTVRNYLKNGGGADSVSHAVLCGTSNKGIVISDSMLVGSEFNGAAPFLKALNGGPDDLIPGVELMAIRSDKNDKYSQPDGRFIGQRGKPTGVSYDASELRGARNVILDGARSPRDGVPQAGLRRAIPVHHRQGRRHAVHRPGAEADLERPGHRHGRRALHQPSRRRCRGRDLRGRSPRPASARRRSRRIARRPAPTASGARSSAAPTPYEFVLRMASQPVTHIYRSPFLRSSDVVHLRPEPFAKADETAAAVVVMSRPRGYFGVGRDKFSLDGKMPPGITDGVPPSRPAGWPSTPARARSSRCSTTRPSPPAPGRPRTTTSCGGVPELTRNSS